MSKILNKFFNSYIAKCIISDIYIFSFIVLTNTQNIHLLFLSIFIILYYFDIDILFFSINVVYFNKKKLYIIR